MPTSKVTYLGDLRTSSLHVQSGSQIICDAPIDNKGKGEAFSPTDTIANGLATCMFTIMGIKAQEMDVDFSGSIAEVTKIMAANPRRIAEIHVTFDMKLKADPKIRAILEHTAITCPVYYSLHPDIKKVIVFNWKG